MMASRSVSAGLGEIDHLRPSGPFQITGRMSRERSAAYAWAAPSSASDSERHVAGLLARKQAAGLTPPVGRSAAPWPPPTTSPTKPVELPASLPLTTPHPQC